MIYTIAMVVVGWWVGVAVLRWLFSPPPPPPPTEWELYQAKYAAMRYNKVMENLYRNCD